MAHSGSEVLYRFPVDGSRIDSLSPAFQMSYRLSGSFRAAD
jgi:hypothetical protein